MATPVSTNRDVLTGICIALVFNNRDLFPPIKLFELVNALLFVVKQNENRYALYGTL